MESTKTSIMRNGSTDHQHEYIKVDYNDSETGNYGNACYTSSSKSSASWCHFPKGKDVMFVILILFCGITMCLNFVRICTLEEKISELSQDTEVTMVTDNAQFMETNSATAIRQGRDASSGNGGLPNRDRYTGYGPGLMPQTGHTSNDHPFIHVAGITSEAVRTDSWFMWHTGDELEYQKLVTAFLPFINNQFVEIIQPGYYYIYSQVTYQDSRHLNDIGHEVIKRPNCGQGSDYRLLHSIQRQTQTHYPLPDFAMVPSDSSYVGGIFYLSTNDLVGVRPHSDLEVRNFVANEGTEAYFGMYLLSADTNAGVERQRNCRDEI